MLAAAGQPRVIVDVEITVQEGTWERSWSGPDDHKEIVQIGAVKIDPEDFSILDRFEMLVRPQRVSQLSALFTRLTGITQEMVERDGVFFPEAYASFAAFRGNLPLHSYGGSRFGGDTSVFAENFVMHAMPKPADWPTNDMANLAPWFHEHAPETKGNNSGRLVTALGLRVPEGEHTGLADCLSIVESMKYLVQKRGIPSPFRP